jgi:hypothetical protein
MSTNLHLTFECAVLFDSGLDCFSIFLNLYAGKTVVLSFTASAPDMETALTRCLEKWELYDHMYGNQIAHLDEQVFDKPPGQLQMF